MIRQGVSPGAVGFFTTRDWGDMAPNARNDGSSVSGRARLGSVYGQIAWVNQVHGSTVVVAAEAGIVGDADALIVDRPNLSPAVVTADCVPLLLANETGSVRAAVHVGRRGLMDGVIRHTLRALASLTTQPLFAVVGPHICGGCYEVSDELAADAAAVSGPSRTRWGTPSIDLATGVRAQLQDVTVRELGICTVESDDFYSYRRDSTHRRTAAVVVIDTP